MFKRIFWISFILSGISTFHNWPLIKLDRYLIYELIVQRILSMGLSSLGFRMLFQWSLWIPLISQKRAISWVNRGSFLINVSSVLWWPGDQVPDVFLHPRILLLQPFKFAAVDWERPKYADGSGVKFSNVFSNISIWIYFKHVSEWRFPH